MKNFVFSFSLLALAGCTLQLDTAPQPQALVSATAPATTVSATAPSQKGPFVRVAQIKGAGKVAEIVVASRDGKSLLYNDATGGKIGFVDLHDPAQPKVKGLLMVGGEPTSLALTRDDRWGMACIRATTAKEKPELVVFEYPGRRIVRRIPLSGQPDCLKISADNRYAVIVIENERGDMDKAMPQAPAGNVTIVDLAGGPQKWKLRTVSLLNLPIRFASDPEPEYIAINARNEAAITLQENNGVCIIDLKSGRVTDAWSCGLTEHAADLKKDDKIDFSDVLRARREPDSLAWTPQNNLVTANEGDYDLDETDVRAGGRNITLFNRKGKVLWDSANQLDAMAAQNGAYNDKRSSKRGVEPEGAEVATVVGKPYAFIGCERAHGVAVYDLSNEANPQLVQWLETGDNPEGIYAIPSRKLLVTANEGDNTLSIFQMK
jgi:DNA-binding beta-propeller fold protein YncE